MGQETGCSRLSLGMGGKSTRMLTARTCATLRNRRTEFPRFAGKTAQESPNGRLPKSDIKSCTFSFGKTARRCPKILVPPSHPKLDRFSIEKHGFGDPV
jgi:hypothetical protein